MVIIQGALQISGLAGPEGKVFSSVTAVHKEIVPFRNSTGHRCHQGHHMNWVQQCIFKLTETFCIVAKNSFQSQIHLGSCAGSTTFNSSMVSRKSILGCGVSYLLRVCMHELICMAEKGLMTGSFVYYHLRERLEKKEVPIPQPNCHIVPTKIPNHVMRPCNQTSNRTEYIVHT